MANQRLSLLPGLGRGRFLKRVNLSQLLQRVTSGRAGAEQATDVQRSTLPSPPQPRRSPKVDPGTSPLSLLPPPVEKIANSSPNAEVICAAPDIPISSKGEGTSKEDQIVREHYCADPTPHSALIMGHRPIIPGGYRIIYVKISNSWMFSMLRAPKERRSLPKSRLWRIECV